MKWIDTLEFEDGEILERMEKTIPSPEAIALGQKYAKEIASNHAPRGSIRWINETLGQGFFLDEALPKGAFAGDYLGLVRENNRHDGLNDYLWRYPVLDSIGRDYVIDARERGNHVHYINHSFSPNIAPHVAFYQDAYHIIFLTLKPLKVGAQLCYNYGEMYWYVRSPPELL